MRAEFELKAEVGKHTHPGNEVAYILEGALELSVEGQGARTLKQGDSFSLPANAVHWAKNVAKGPTNAHARVAAGGQVTPTSPASASTSASRSLISPARNSTAVQLAATRSSPSA